MKSVSIKLLLAFLFLPLALYSEPVKVGIAKDASGYELNLLGNQVKSEIAALLRADKNVTYKELNADWELNKIIDNLNSLLVDPKVDIVVTLGFLSSEAAARLQAYPKPVIAATILDPELQNLRIKSDKRTGIPNFAWIEPLIQLKNDMHSFTRIFEANNLAIIIPENLYDTFPMLMNYLVADENQFDVSFIPVGDNKNLEEDLPSGTDGAIVFPLVHHNDLSTEAVFSSLNKQGIPSLAVNGPAYLEQGATVTFTPQLTFQQLARQVAVMVSRASEGTNLADIPFMTDEQERTPIINMESLRLTDRFPKWADLRNAVLLNADKIPGENLTLHQAIALALENNLQGKITDLDLLMAEKDIRIAKANVLPQVEVSGTGIQLSDNLVESSMGQRGEFTVTGSVSLKQVIYSEAAYANYALKKLVAESTRHGNKQQTLDLILDVSQAYISLLFAKNNLHIKNEQVSATLKNLNLAKAKEKKGEGSISDVNRWTSELNLGRIDLNDAEAAYLVSMYKLNQLLNQPVGNPIATPDSADIGETIIHHQHVLDFYLSTPKLTESYAGFLITEMRTSSPELQQLETAGAIVDRQKSMKIRQMYLPEVAMIGSADQAFLRKGVIRNPQLPVPPPPDDITWNLGLRLSIPIFEGGRKKSEMQRATIEQERIAWQKDDLLSKLEMGIRSNVQFLQASYRELELAKNAAHSAKKNYFTIQDAYAHGMVNAAQLADAHNVMIRTRQVALSSHYQYILDYIKTERLQGNFSFLEDDSERMNYINRLLNYSEEK